MIGRNAVVYSLLTVSENPNGMMGYPTLDWHHHSEIPMVSHPTLDWHQRFWAILNRVPHVSQTAIRLSALPIAWGW